MPSTNSLVVGAILCTVSLQDIAATMSISQCYDEEEGQEEDSGDKGQNQQS